MDVLLNAVDMISRASSTNHDVNVLRVYSKSVNHNSNEVRSPITSMKDSSNHTQTISVASSEPSDDEDESATTISYPPGSMSVNGDESRINWKNNPTQSFSDCTIEIVVKSTHDTMPHVFNRPSGNPDAPVPKSKLRTYHVHRSILAYGQRRSLYFVKLFQKNYVQSNNDTDEEQLYRKCRIYLTKDVAKAFPSLLEYMYATHEEALQIINSDNIIPLHFLSKILQVTCLRSATEKFYEADLSVLNCFKYYQQAHALNGQKIMKAVTKTVIDNLSKIKLQSELLTDFNALSLWKHVVQSKHRANTVNESIQISTLVACFCKLHRKLLQKEDFIRLTDVRYMPVIHYQVALPLLEISKELRTTESTGTLNRLQIRCLDAFVQSWKVWMTNPNFDQALAKLDVFELYYLLNSALNSSEEKAPLIQSIRKHQADINQQKEPAVSGAPVVSRKAAPPRSVALPSLPAPPKPVVERPPVSSPPRTPLPAPQASACVVAAPTPQQAPRREPQRVQQAPRAVPQPAPQQAPVRTPQFVVQQAPRAVPQPSPQQAPVRSPQFVVQQAPRAAPQPAPQQFTFRAPQFVQQAPRAAPQPAPQQVPFRAPQFVQQAPSASPQPPPPQQAAFRAPQQVPTVQRFISQQPPNVAVPVLLQGSPHQHQMKVLAVPVHAAPMTMNNAPQPVILHPLQYQHILQQREIAWSDFRKRKQMADAVISEPHQLAQVAAQAHAVAQQQQHAAQQHQQQLAVQQQQQQHAVQQQQQQLAVQQHHQQIAVQQHQQQIAVQQQQQQIAVQQQQQQIAVQHHAAQQLQFQQQQQYAKRFRPNNAPFQPFPPPQPQPNFPQAPWQGWVQK